MVQASHVQRYLQFHLLNFYQSPKGLHHDQFNYIFIEGGGGRPCWVGEIIGGFFQSVIRFVLKLYRYFNILN